MVDWRSAAFKGVRRVECSFPKMAGRNPSRPAAYTSREEVKKDPRRKIS